jgi:Tol biopolymer transport system component
MRCVRSVSILIFLLVLAFGIFFPIVYADDTAVIATTITTEPTVTTNVSTAETTRQAEITPATPVPTDSGTIQPTETITPATTETPIPTAAQITTIPIMTHEPSQAALNLPATTLVTTITTGATATPTPTLASSGGTCSAPQVSDGTCTGSSEQYPAMHLSQEQLDKIDTELSRAPRVSAAPMAAFTGSGFSGSYSGPPLPRSVNLLPYLPYTLSQRDQGSCGNCWVWASTGALEISHAVQNNVKDRLSIQYFNSNYNHTTTSNACCGGWLSTYTDWYNADTANRKPIPWSNTNAGWGGSGTDYSQSYCNAMSKVSYNSITNSPNYPVSSMSSSVVSTYGYGQSAAVANIKSQIAANKPVWYGFFENSTGWSAFTSFWGTKNGDQIWNPDPWAHAGYNGEVDGHAVLIVGYNDTDPNPDNAYWLVLNSWYTPAGRQDDTFRLKMYMNYDSQYESLTWRQQHWFQILNANFNTPALPAPTVTGITPSSGLNTSSVSITNLAGTNFYGVPTVILNQTGYSDNLSTDVTVGSPASISCTFPITNMPAGRYNVTVINPDGKQAMLVNGFTVMSVLSSKAGEYVAFESDATNLVTGDTNGMRDIFVRDRQTGMTYRVSRDSAGVEGNGNSYNASLSWDGMYVTFESDATNLVTGDTNGMRDIFVRDRQTGTSYRVSRDSAGAEANGNSNTPSISADGRYVTFESDATNLVTGDTNGRRDIFVRDRNTGTTYLVSRDSAGAEANGNSNTPSISTDGRYVTFESDATNLVTGDTNGMRDIFVRDRQTGMSYRVSRDSAGAEANGNSNTPSISADGRYVTFESDATNLVTGDTNGMRDIFVRDRQTGTSYRVSRDSAGAEGNGDSYYPSISTDGRYVAFESDATNLVTGDTNGMRDIFVRDRQTGTSYRVSRDSAGAEGNGNSNTPTV